MVETSGRTSVPNPKLSTPPPGFRHLILEFKNFSWIDTLLEKFPDSMKKLPELLTQTTSIIIILLAIQTCIFVWVWNGPRVVHGLACVSHPPPPPGTDLDIQAKKQSKQVFFNYLYLGEPWNAWMYYDHCFTINKHSFPSPNTVSLVNAPTHIMHKKHWLRFIHINSRLSISKISLLL